MGISPDFDTLLVISIMSPLVALSLLLSVITVQAILPPFPPYWYCRHMNAAEAPSRLEVTWRGFYECQHLPGVEIYESDKTTTDEWCFNDASCVNRCFGSGHPGENFSELVEALKKATTLSNSYLDMGNGKEC